MSVFSECSLCNLWGKCIKFQCVVGAVYAIYGESVINFSVQWVQFMQFMGKV
jgi:hypothetical protein